MPSHASPTRPTSKKNRLSLAASLTVLLLLTGGGTAVAWWSSPGTGSGSASTGSSENFTITSTTSGEALTPGGGAQTMTFTVSNPSAGTQYLSLITTTIAHATSAFASGSCSEADYSLGTPDVAYGEIPAGGSVTGTVSIAMIDRSVNQNDCKDVVVPVQFEAR